ncbi:Ulp1-like peptidase [Cucumis melo var. makuwa]|uniref:Ulp1-like peptidase n=1 Tax=Cucumis melo var. makuwa TaxID=1194695 RepID=A0A5D3CUR7_CUCMM|nr:Ulp1-like peptidase [Cucumis melo var. makuwa]TYK15235.1 Ulp1-like peptidase [Cucumis melo var. makuwa]
MESQIRGDDNIEMEDDESMPDINNSDNTTPDDTTNNQSLDNNNLQSTSSPQLSPRKKKRQTVADESEMHPMTKKKSCRSNDKKQQSHSKSYKILKKNIKEVHKDVSALTSIVCRMDDTIRKQSLELSEIKQILERLLQNREDMMTNDQPYIEEQHTQDHNVETQREHQEESGSDISINGRDAYLLLTIIDKLDNLNAQSKKEKYLPEMITTLPLVSQPLPLCEIQPTSSSTLNQPAMAPLDQTVKIQEVSPSISIVNEESQLEIQNNDHSVTLAEIEKENEQVTEEQTIGNEQQSTSTERIESQSEIQKNDQPATLAEIENEKENEQVTEDQTIGTVQQSTSTEKIESQLLGWGDVNYLTGCINIKEHWLAVAADMGKCKIYVFDLMPNYVDKKLVD